MAAGAALLLCAACSDDSSAGGDDACVAQYSREKGYGYESEKPICAAPPPPAPEPDCPAATPQSIAEECRAAGTECDPERFITRQAAECIARSQGLAQGIAPWRATLHFDATVRRPLWTIENTLLEDAANCSRSGETIQIDASTGAASAVSQWSAIC